MRTLPFDIFLKDMRQEKIEVVAYSGHRGEETPRTIILHDKTIEVFEILDRWIEEGFEERTRKRFFEIKGNNGNTYKIYYDEKAMEWLYVVED